MDMSSCQHLANSHHLHVQQQYSRQLTYTADYSTQHYQHPSSSDVFYDLSTESTVVGCGCTPPVSPTDFAAVSDAVAAGYSLQYDTASSTGA